jgi:transcriptional regulator with XRE-family HTH domain
MEAAWEWFAGRLRELRAAAGLTQRGLADKAGMTEAGVRNLEQGRTGPTWETVVRLSQALEVDCTAFTTKPAVEAESPRPRGRPRRAASQEGAAPAPGGGQAQAGTPPPAAKGRSRKGRDRGGKTGR